MRRPVHCRLYRLYRLGWPGMVDSAIRVLRDHGVGEQNIFYDKFLDASHMQGGRVAAG